MDQYNGYCQLQRRMSILLNVQNTQFCSSRVTTVKIVLKLKLLLLHLPHLLELKETLGSVSVDYTRNVINMSICFSDMKWILETPRLKLISPILHLLQTSFLQPRKYSFSPAHFNKSSVLYYKNEAQLKCQI